MTTQFTYNGDGHRLRKVADGVTTTYVIAILGLPQVLVETTGGNSTAYLHGHDLLGEKDTAWTWHLNDGLGSVRQLTGGNGDVTLTQGYTPFGLLLWQEGDAATTYGFTGEQQDPAVALVFLRARYYDPATGRFLSKDPFLGLVSVPATLHPYLYSLNNPVNYTDPSGEYIESLWDIAMILLDIGFLASDIYYYTEVNPCTDPWEIISVIGLDAVALTLDVVCLAIPILPGGWGTGLRLAGGGMAALTRAVAHVPQIAQTAQAALKGVQTAEQIVHFARAKDGGSGGVSSLGGGVGDGSGPPKIGNRSVAEVAGDTPFRPIQDRVDGSYVERFAQAMREEKFDWNAMGDRILIIRANDGMFIGEGHHRVLATQLAGVEIPESAIRYMDIPGDMGDAIQVRGWEDVRWSGH